MVRTLARTLWTRPPPPSSRNRSAAANLPHADRQHGRRGGHRSLASQNFGSTRWSWSGPGTPTSYRRSPGDELHASCAGHSSATTRPVVDYAGWRVGKESASTNRYRNWRVLSAYSLTAQQCSAFGQRNPRPAARGKTGDSLSIIANTRSTRANLAGRKQKRRARTKFLWEMNQVLTARSGKAYTYLRQ